MLRPCAFAAAAATLAWDDESPATPPPHRFAAVSAFAVAAYAAANAGSFCGPLLAGALRHEAWSVLHLICGALTLVAATLAAGAVLLGRGGTATRATVAAGPYRAAPPPAPSLPVPVALGGVAILVATEAMYQVGVSLTASFLPAAGVASQEWLVAVSPGAVGVASLFVFGLLVAGTVQQASLPPLALYGAGLVVVALGLVVVAAAGGSSVALYALGTAVAGIGEAAAYGIPIAYAAIAVRGRAATVVVSGYLVTLTLVSTVTNAVGQLEALRMPLFVTSAILDLALGAAALVFARRLHRSFFEGDPARG